MAQRQHLLKQKEAQQIAAAAANANLAKSHNNVIGNVKTSTIIERKTDDVSGVKTSWDPVPPLAPLSSGLVHNNIRQSSIITPAPTVCSPKIDEDSNSTNQSASSSIYGTNPTTPNCGDDVEGTFAGFEGLLIPGGSMKAYGDDESKDANNANKQSPVVSNNKMLADLLERKSADPPFNIQHADAAAKRKIDGNDAGEPSTKRIITETETVVIDDDDSDDALPVQKTTTSSNAANLYAKLAASLLEDEDMELDETINNNTNVMQTNQMQPSLPPPIVEPQKSVITVPMQRQIIVSPNNPPQMILAPTPNNPPIGQATATIKTDTGYQTVPVILQNSYSHGNPNQMTNIQIQKQYQPVIQQSQTQYVLATNNQGQTYLLAQQPTPPPVNQILLTQTSQQQGGAPTKTIIILQQQAGPNVQGGTHQTMAGGPQKMIMTTQQGQQMIVTQVPRPMQHHVIVNSHSMANATSGNVIQTAPVISTSSSIINQVATGSLPTLSSHQQQQQPQIVSQIQLQQTQAQLSLPPLPQIHQPIIQMQKQQPNTVYVQSDKKSATEKKVFITGSGNIEITEVAHSSHANIMSQQKHHPSSPIFQVKNTPISSSSQTTPQIQTPPVSTTPTASTVAPSNTVQTAPVVKVDDDAEWLFICDWRGCQRYV